MGSTRVSEFLSLLLYVGEALLDTSVSVKIGLLFLCLWYTHWLETISYLTAQEECNSGELCHRSLVGHSFILTKAVKSTSMLFLKQQCL